MSGPNTVSITATVHPDAMPWMDVFAPPRGCNEEIEYTLEAVDFYADGTVCKSLVRTNPSDVRHVARFVECVKDRKEYITYLWGYEDIGAKAIAVSDGESALIFSNYNYSTFACRRERHAYELKMTNLTDEFDWTSHLVESGLYILPKDSTKTDD